jgi:hypothetical protein
MNETETDPVNPGAAPGPLASAAPAPDPAPATAARKSTARKAKARKAVAAAKPDTAPRGPGRPAKFDKMEEGLTETFSMLALAVGMFDTYDGIVAVGQAPSLAKAFRDLAEKDPKIEKALTSLMSAGAYSQLIATVAGIAIPVLVNHGVIPRGPATDPLCAKHDALYAAVTGAGAAPAVNVTE